jgi:transcriptional regulator with XRE-family HTH domain
MLKTLGERIRELRDKQDMALRELARKLGDVSPAHVSDIENNRRNPSEDLLRKMAHVLGVPFEELQKLDTRVPVEELKEATRRDPALGFALRTLADHKVSAEDLLKLAQSKPKRKEDK